VKTSHKPLAALLLLLPATAVARQIDKPKPYTALGESDVLDYRYSFPTVVGTYPALLAKIRGDQADSLAHALEEARAGASASAEHHFPFHRHDFWRDWTVAGNAYPLLSLTSHTDFFTGGAHPNHVSSALLWDEKRDAEIDIDQLFGGAGLLWKQIGPSYCRKLVAERLRREVSTATSCPARKDLTIVPVDSDFNYAFDSLRIIADPYVAGSYAEGAYVISLPVTPTMVESIEPGYRGTFEAQRQ
jgi:hypothetical protein